MTLRRSNKDSHIQTCLKAVRKFCELIKPWQCTLNLDLLGERQENEAYMLANPGVAYEILMTDSYSDCLVQLDTREHRGKYALTWINLQTGRILKAKKIIAKDEVRIKMP